MARVANFANQTKCIRIRTETWSFKARGFYEKMAFSVYGELTDYFLKKVLITQEEEYPGPIK